MSLQGYARVHGTEATFSQVALGTYDPEAGTATDTETNTAIRGVLTTYRVDEIGEGIDTDDRKYLLPASQLTVEPDTEDRVTIDSVIYEIVTVQRIEKRGVTEMYVLQIRRTK